MPPRHYTQARGRTQYLSGLRLKPKPVEGTVALRVRTRNIGGTFLHYCSVLKRDNLLYIEFRQK